MKSFKPQNINPLPASFYRRTDVVQIARDLLGKVLCTYVDGQYTAGKITETEAYCGRNDKACHANNGTRTDRTETMYQAGGTSYIYLCYGIHHLFNVVTNVVEKADAVLIRAIEPIDGLPVMQKRRERNTEKPTLTAGPGRLSQALGITKGLDGSDLTDGPIWIEDRKHITSKKEVHSSPRIGIDYAGDHAKRPWRFYLANNSWISQP